MCALEAQVKQLGFQAAQDCESLTKDKTLALQLLHKVSAPEDARGDVSPAGSLNFVISGTRTAVRAGEEVPSLNWRPGLPKAQQQHPGGERSTPSTTPEPQVSLPASLTRPNL